jgi:prepilin-type N-terminal cleavage/methylation domain-containing protein
VLMRTSYARGFTIVELVAVLAVMALLLFVGGLGWTWVDTNIPSGLPETFCWYYPWWGSYCATGTPTHDTTKFSYNLGGGGAVRLRARGVPRAGEPAVDRLRRQLRLVGRDAVPHRFRNQVLKEP